MPIYVFRCSECGEQFDHLQKLSDPDPDTCPHCGKQHSLRRQVTAPAFRLAGSGWYETDFKSDKEKKRNLADNGQPKPEAAAPSGGGKDGGDGAKPAAKPAADQSAGAASD